MRNLVRLLVVTTVLAAPAAAGAHPERTTFFPDGEKGSVPVMPSFRGGTQHVVCKSDTKARINKIYAGAKQKKVRLERLAMLRRCKFEHIQAAVDAARSGDKVLIMPGVYREEPSRKVPLDPGENECGPKEIPDDGDAPVATYEYQLRCPNARNLIAILGDGNAKDDDRTCNQKCNLLVRGMGRKPEDVVIEADRIKKDAIRADRADGIMIFNITVEQAAFNGIDVVETNGFWLERNVGRFNQNYGILTFASDHGVYERIEAFGNGDSGVYPGSGPEGHCKRYGIEIRNSDIHDNNMGFSGTAGNGTWYHDNKFHHNGAGGANDSFASGHPGMPQDCSKWTENEIFSNNKDEIYDSAHDKLCASTPFEKRDREYLCPQFQIPTGSGFALYGGNGNIVENNYIYDQHRDGIRQFNVPALIRGENDPGKARDTSHDNRYAKNFMGMRKDGTRDPNGVDFFWDEQGHGNCWENNIASGTLRTDPSPLPRCPGSKIDLPGNQIKLASQVTCATWNPRDMPDPPGCDWFVAPPEPK